MLLNNFLEKKNVITSVISIMIFSAYVNEVIIVDNSYWGNKKPE
jgi:hypothetical protein